MDWEEYVGNFRAKYDKWLAEGKIANTSKVFPVKASLRVKQWVMPTEQAMHFIRNARSFALAHCTCRTLGKHCDNPTEVCFVLNDVADAWIKQGRGRRVTLEEAEAALIKANEHRLVPMTLYNPDQDLFALCNCCECCCHDLQLLKVQGRKELVAHSEYIAEQDNDACVHCGVCVDRCVFDARAVDGDQVVFDPQACYGCGLCVTTCPAEAISMELRRDLEKKAVEAA